MTRYEIEVFADYFQFYLWDSGVNPEAPTDYRYPDLENRVKVETNVVAVCTVRNMTVPVELQIHDRDPWFDPDEWDHVVEAALDLPTGGLQVHECTGYPVLDLSIDPGIYRVRLLFAGLDSLSEDGLEGNDRYTVVLWTGSEQGVCVRKQWRAPTGEGRA